MLLQSVVSTLACSGQVYTTTVVKVKTGMSNRSQADQYHYRSQTVKARVLQAVGQSDVIGKRTRMEPPSVKSKLMMEEEKICSSGLYVTNWACDNLRKPLIQVCTTAARILFQPVDSQ